MGGRDAVRCAAKAMDAKVNKNGDCDAIAGIARLMFKVSLVKLEVLGTKQRASASDDIQWNLI